MATDKNLPEDDDNPQDDFPDISDVVVVLLEPYIPAKSEKESDIQFSTNEIIAALELHYGVPQGNPDYYTKNAGVIVVSKLKEMGFIFINTGGLQLQWLMKKRVSA